MAKTMGRHTSITHFIVQTTHEPDCVYDYAQRIKQDAQHIDNAEVMGSILSVARDRLLQMADPAPASSSDGPPHGKRDRSRDGTGKDRHSSRDDKDSDHKTQRAKHH